MRGKQGLNRSSAVTAASALRPEETVLENNVHALVLLLSAVIQITGKD